MALAMHDPKPRKLKGRRRAVTCGRCGYQWQPYGRRLPYSCARCKSPYWHLPRTRRPPTRRQPQGPRPPRPQARRAADQTIEDISSIPAATPQARKAALLPRLQARQAEGLTLQAIANRLNAEGVPTISGRGQWQKGTVGKLLAQAEGERC